MVEYVKLDAVDAALRWFDVRDAPKLRGAGMVDDGVDVLRRRYVVDACRQQAVADELQAWVAAGMPEAWPPVAGGV